LDKNIPDSLKCCLGIELKNSNFILIGYILKRRYVVWRHVLKMISLINTNPWVPYVASAWECGSLSPLSAAPEHDNCMAKMTEPKCRTYVCCSGQSKRRRRQSCRRRKVLPSKKHSPKSSRLRLQRSTHTPLRTL